MHSGLFRMLANIRISRKISLLVAFPMLVIVALTGHETWNASSAYFASVATEKKLSGLGRVEPLMHRLQVERGRSAGFLGNTKASIQPLAAARKNVDEELKTFALGMPELRKVLDDRSTTLVKKIETELGKILRMRTSINTRSVKGPKLFGFYTGLITDLNELSHHLVDSIHQAEIARHGLAVLDIGEAKELAGRERGMFNGILGTGKISTAQLAQFMSLKGGQETLLNIFLSTADKKHLAQYKTMVNEVRSKELTDMRRAAIEAYPFIISAGITQQQWFKVTTKRIGKLRDIQLLAYRNLVRDAREATASTFDTAMIFIGAAILALAITIGLGFALAYSISTPLVALSRDMERVAQGDFSIAIHHVERRDEIGVMAQKLEFFRDSARDKLGIERAAEQQRISTDQERERTTSELEAAVSVVGDGLRQLADGDLTARINQSLGPQFDELLKDYNEALGKLNIALLEVADSANSMANGCNEIASASDDLAERTELQASTVQQASMSVSSVNENIKSVAQGASLCHEKAQVAMQSAEDGTSIVSEAIAAMSDIEVSSAEIETITGVIDEIAFQTNLLALNAGVEAARAGEAGRGFAVVATEVRALAQRSADAAQKIKDLIAGSANHVQQGVSLVRKTGSALEEINTNVGSISEVVAEITGQLKDQVHMVDQLNKGVLKLENATQENAAMVEESNAATRTLTDQARSLRTLVSRFKTSQLNDGHADRAVQDRHVA